MVSKYQANLSLEHWIVIKHILKFLKKMKDYKFVF